MDLEENKGNNLAVLIKRKNGNVISYDTLVKLRCSDGNVLTLSKHRLDTFNFYKKIFTDEPDLEEIDCVHTSEEMLTLLEHVRSISNDRKVDIPLLSKLMCYYDNTNESNKKNLLNNPGDIVSLCPGTEEYFRKEIINIFDDISSSRVEWFYHMDDYKFSINMKAIIFDEMREPYKNKRRVKSDSDDED